MCKEEAGGMKPTEEATNLSNGPEEKLEKSKKHPDFHRERVFSRFIPPKFSFERPELCPATTTSTVTCIQKVNMKLPYNSEISKVTEKIAVMRPKREKSVAILNVFLWLYFQVTLISVITFLALTMNQKCEKCNRKVATLLTVISQMEERILKLTTGVINLHSLHNSLEIIDSELPSNSSGDAVSRIKRSDKGTNASRWDLLSSAETVAVQFSGSKPFGFSAVPPKGILGPWVESANDLRVVEAFGARLNDVNSTLEVDEDGLYMIYAQVTYLSNSSSNSYSINIVSSADRTQPQPIATCSSSGKIAQIGEVSCYTSVVTYLDGGDIVYIQQAQPGREVIFSKAYTYFGLIFLD